MVRHALAKNQTYYYNKAIVEHLQKVAGEQKFNRFVTLSFVYSKYGHPLNKSDVLTVSRLVGAFFNNVSEKLNGRRRKSDNKDRPKVPAIGFPEYRNKSNGKTFLHYHCLLSIPDDKLEYFHHVTKLFWNRVIKNTIGFPPRIDSRVAHDPKGAAYYSNKFIEDGFTLENSVFHGVSLR